jgi:hypothetical protein
MLTTSDISRGGVPGDVSNKLDGIASIISSRLWESLLRVDSVGHYGMKAPSGNLLTTDRIGSHWNSNKEML